MANEIRDQANEEFRDFTIPGNPSSGAHKPAKRGVRQLFSTINDKVEALDAAAGEIPNLEAAIASEASARASADGALSNRIDSVENAAIAGYRFYATKAALDADTTQPDGTRAVVDQDAEAGNNGIYAWTGGAWTRIGDYAPDVVTEVNALREKVPSNAPGDYAFSVVDDEGLAALAIREDGTTVVASLEVTEDFTAEEIGPEHGKIVGDIPDGYVWSVLDGDGFAAIGMRGDGTMDIPALDKVGTINGIPIDEFGGGGGPSPTAQTDILPFPDVRGPSSYTMEILGSDTYVRGHEVVPVLPDMTSLALWGSSSMAGMTTAIQASAASRGVTTVYAGGSGGSTVTTLVAYLGAIPARLTVEDGVIPASGPVNVTWTNGWGNEAFTATGVLGGVRGLVNSSGGTMTFTRSVAGDPVPVGFDPLLFNPEVGPTKRNMATFLWIGKNDLTRGATAEATAAKTDAVFDWLSPLVKRAIVLGHFVNRGTSTSSPVYEQIVKTNQLHAQRYGPQFIDVREYLMSEDVWTDTGITPTAGDLTAQTDGILPPSLTNDGSHMNEAASNAVNDLLWARVDALGWYS